MPDLVVLTATAPEAYRHTDTIEAGVAMMRDLASGSGLSLLHTEDASELAGALSSARAVVFHQVNGTVLNDPARSALLAFVRGGGGFAAVHNASSAEPDWPDYLSLVPARFVEHPNLDEVPRPVRRRGTHASVDHLPDPWAWSDEWYRLDRAPQGVDVLLTVTDPDDPAADRPLSWAGRCGAGRTWYTALGHRGAAYEDAAFQQHLWGGITSVLR